MRNDENNIAKIAGIFQITEYDSLAKNVLKQSGKGNNVDDMLDKANSLENISMHGINGGYHGFVYTKDTCEFFDNNKINNQKLNQYIITFKFI